jgi:hypothetical protein
LEMFVRVKKKLDRKRVERDDCTEIRRQWREMIGFDFDEGGAMLAMGVSALSFVLLRY